MSPDSLGPDLYNALHGQRVGARILQVAPGREGYPAAVAVYDVLPTRATGEPVAPREGLPTVTLGPYGEPTITVPATDPPTQAIAQPLVRGDGPQVEAGQVVTVQYVGVTWSDGKVFDSTWADGKLPADFPIGVGSLPSGWDEGIVEQTVGSQVLLVLPPDSGFAGTDQDLAEPDGGVRGRHPRRAWRPGGAEARRERRGARHPVPGRGRGPGGQGRQLRRPARRRRPGRAGPPVRRRGRRRGDVPGRLRLLGQPRDHLRRGAPHRRGGVRPAHRGWRGALGRGRGPPAAGRGGQGRGEHRGDRAAGAGGRDRRAVRQPGAGALGGRPAGGGRAADARPATR